MTCEEYQYLLSCLHDEGKEPTPEILSHAAQCHECDAFRKWIQRVQNPPFDEKDIPDFWEKVRPHIQAVSPRIKPTWHLWNARFFTSAAVIALVLTVLLYVREKTSSLERSCEELRIQNINLQNQLLVLQRQQPMFLAKEALEQYDRRNYEQAKVGFLQLAESPCPEEIKAMSLYYLALMAYRENDIPGSLFWADSLLESVKSPVYLNSVRLLLEQIEERLIRQPGTEQKKKIHLLLQRISSSQATSRTDIVLSY